MQPAAVAADRTHMCQPHDMFDQTPDEHCDVERDAVGAGLLAGHPNTLALHLVMRPPCGHGVLDLHGIDLDDEGVATVAAADEWHRAEHNVDDDVT